MSVYACSDLHGHLNFYNMIKNYLKPEDKVYFLGDAGDRGPKSWETIKAIANDPQWIYMKGNHEDMLCKAMEDFALFDCFDYAFDLLVHNGGHNTFEGWCKDGWNQGWISFLKRLPTHMEYTRPDGKIVLLSHAGYSPYSKVKFPCERDLIWDRSHFEDSWPEGFENYFAVHGHTPIPFMSGEEKIIKAFEYCGGHKFNIDAGAFVTNSCILFNLDTFESIIFDS